MTKPLKYGGEKHKPSARVPSATELRKALLSQL